jgi:hypothetical protein
LDRPFTRYPDSRGRYAPGGIDPLDITVGDIVLLEVLQGARDDSHVAAIERSIRQFEIAAMVDEAQAAPASRCYRLRVFLWASGLARLAGAA